MFATIASVYLGFWAIMWSSTGWYNIALKLTAGILAFWGLGVALIYWGYVIPPLSQ